MSKIKQENSDQATAMTSKETYTAPEMLKHEGIVELTSEGTGSREIGICPRPSPKDR